MFRTSAAAAAVTAARGFPLAERDPGFSLDTLTSVSPVTGCSLRLLVQNTDSNLTVSLWTSSQSRRENPQRFLPMSLVSYCKNTGFMEGELKQ